MTHPPHPTLTYVHVTLCRAAVGWFIVGQRVPPGKYAWISDCCITALFTVSHVISHPGCLGLLSAAACLPTCLPLSLNVSTTHCSSHFFFISSIHVKHCENFIFTFWWNVWLFPLKNQFYPLCCWTGYKAKALFLKLTVCLNYELIINNLLNIFPHVFYQKTVLTTDIVYVW